MRVVRRILLILFIVLAVVVGAAAVYANSTAAKRQLRAFILRELNETYGIPTEFDDLEVRFFPLSVTVYGLRVSHPTEGPFLDEYRVAYLAWRAGNHDVVFPAGTWLFRVRHAARCRPPPPS